MDFHSGCFFSASYKPCGGCYIPNVVHLKSQNKFKIHWVNTVTSTKCPAQPLKVLWMNGCGVVWCIMSGFC